MSLNFRPVHDRSGKFSNFRFYAHHLLVLLGFQPSISSILRGYIFPTSSSNPSRTGISTLDNIRHDLPGIKTTAAYLIFSDGDDTLSMEKDQHKSLTGSASDFIVATNHDVAEENTTQSFKATRKGSFFKALPDDIVVESISRKLVVVNSWKKSLKGAKRKSSRRSNSHKQDLTRDSIIGWMNTYPILNEETHFATIMDPKDGKVVWIKRYLEPLKWE